MAGGLLGGLGGLSQRLNDGMMSPLGAMGMQLMANHGTPQTQGMFNGVPQAVQGAMQYKSLQEQKMKEEQSRNMTADMLDGMGMTMEAEALRGGVIDGNTAFKLISDKQKGVEPKGLINAGDGNLYDQDNGTWITAPGGGKVDEYDQRRQAAEQNGLTPDDPSYQPFILTGKMPREDQQALTPTDKKAMWAAEDEIPALDNTIASLDRAKELNKKTFTGVTAGMRGWLGTAVPGGDYAVDGQAAAATSEFGKIMSMEAITAMAQTLKGATTDSELERFVNILADPSTPPDIRERTIDRMKTLAQRVRQVKVSRIQSINGEPAAPSQPAAGGGYKIRSVREQ